MKAGEALIAFDVGNTSVKGAVEVGGAWKVILLVPTRPFEDLGDRLADALTACAASIPDGPRRRVASSVCAEADAALAEDCRRHGVPGPKMFGRDLPIPLPAGVKEPERVGTDRLLCALGARELVGAPCIVVGAGTAVTVDLVDADGGFAGGAIAPGLSLSARALHDGTSALPLVEPSRPERAVGRDTEEALRSGVYHVWHAGVCGLVRLMRQEAGYPQAPVVVTGGNASLLVPLDAEGTVEQAPELIFLGMSAALGLAP